MTPSKLRYIYKEIHSAKKTLSHLWTFSNCSPFERKLEEENELSANDNQPCFQVSLCVILLLLRVENETKMVSRDFRYHSRWKNNLSQPLTYPMTVVKINRVIAIPYIYFSTHPLICPLYTHLLLVAYLMFRMRTMKERTCVLLISFPQKSSCFVLQLFFKQQRMPLPTFLGYNIIS